MSMMMTEISAIAGIIGFIMLHCLSLSSAESVEGLFHVKPGAGKHSEEKELGKFKCRFTYAVNGGTGEEWKIKLEIIESIPAVACTVERRSSYLMFEEFELQLTGPGVSIQEMEVKAVQMSNQNVKPDEVERGPNSVWSKKGSFKNQLDKVAVFSPLPTRDDL